MRQQASHEGAMSLCLFWKWNIPNLSDPFLVSRWQIVAPTLAKCPTWLDRWTGHSDWQSMVSIPLLCFQIYTHSNYLQNKVALFYKYVSSVPPALAGPLQEYQNYTLGSHVSLLCEATGVPAPSITWLKDGTPIGKRKAMRGQIGIVWTCHAWRLLFVNTFPVQRAVCSGSGPSEGIDWSWGLSLCLMLERTPVWPRTVKVKYRKTTHLQCRVKSCLQFEQKWDTFILENSTYHLWKEWFQVAFRSNPCPT